MITHMETIAIPVSDQDKSRDFYVQVLGFELVKDKKLGPGRWIEVSPPGSQTVLVLSMAPGQGPPIGEPMGMVFACDNLQATYQDLQTKGVEFTQVPVETPFGTGATFLDIDGNEFGLGQPQ